MKNIKLIVLVLFLSAFFFNGCATILTGDKDLINFKSEPIGAEIYMDGLKIGKTPTSIEIKRSGFNDKIITLKLDGYEDRIFALQKEYNLISLLNFGTGIIGWGVDFLTGSIMKYSIKAYNIDLDPKVFNIEELESDKFGNLIIPNEESPFLVYDEIIGYKILFQ